MSTSMDFASLHKHPLSFAVRITYLPPPRPWMARFHHQMFFFQEDADAMKLFIHMRANPSLRLSSHHATFLQGAGVGAHFVTNWGLDIKIRFRYSEERQHGEAVQERKTVEKEEMLLNVTSNLNCQCECRCGVPAVWLGFCIEGRGMARLRRLNLGTLQRMARSAQAGEEFVPGLTLRKRAYTSKSACGSRNARCVCLAIMVNSTGTAPLIRENTYSSSTKRGPSCQTLRAFFAKCSEILIPSAPLPGTSRGGLASKTALAGGRDPYPHRPR